ncbi:uncharacterized protein BDV17DRAFT_293560 [Aspergillus undulatus]|uniref:uncharacterized protein n=1 Tax=Aspergillus undulatus TaxID=1810928 RepID=UPI003CCCB711
MHLQSGLAILKEMKLQRRALGAASVPVEDSLLDAFLHLESQSTHHGVSGLRLGRDFRTLHDQYKEHLYEFRTLQDVQQAFNPLINTTLPFLERCWSRPGAEIMAEYGTLHTEQQQLLSCLHQFGAHLACFYRRMYAKLALKQQRGADMVRLTQLAMVLTVKTCLYTRGCPEPASFMPEYQELLSSALAVIAKFEERPLMTIDTTICPALFVIAARCPDYSLRWQAINALQSWPHCEGYLNLTLIVDLVIEGMKGELRQLWKDSQATSRPPPPGQLFEESMA